MFHNLAPSHLSKSISYSSSKNLSTLARLDLIKFPDILNTQIHMHFSLSFSQLSNCPNPFHCQDTVLSLLFATFIECFLCGRYCSKYITCNIYFIFTNPIRYSIISSTETRTHICLFPLESIYSPITGAMPCIFSFV